MTWGVWSDCSVSCGSGQRTRKRTCSNPSPVGTGAGCPGISSETMSCSVIACPVQGIWSSWSSWSTCSTTCGPGLIHRIRNCSELIQSELQNDCPGVPIQYDTCETRLCPVDGSWLTWGVWSDCSVSCGSGQRTRKRTCSNPSPVGTGSVCSGSSAETTYCSVIACPVNGGWASWSSWSARDAICEVGAGTSYRRRSCSNPYPSSYGAFCTGDPIQYKSCAAVRLMGSSKAYSGRVEICYKSQWGTVCDDSWDNNDARVVCRMIGRSGGISRSNAYYGQGTGTILLDDVVCNGSEGSLFDCQHREIGIHDCVHSEDAGVDCE